MGYRSAVTIGFRSAGTELGDVVAVPYFVRQLPQMIPQRRYPVAVPRDKNGAVCVRV